MLVEYAVLRLDVSVVDASLVKVDDGQRRLSKVVRSKRLGKVAHSELYMCMYNNAYMCTRTCLYIRTCTLILHYYNSLRIDVTHDIIQAPVLNYRGSTGRSP